MKKMIMNYLIVFYNGLTNKSRSYIDSIAGNIFRNMTIKEAKELLDKMAENYDKWTLNEEDDTKVIPEERGILTLSNKVMKEAIEEKRIKYVDPLELSERGIKLAIDEPCIPIQVYVVVPTKVKKKVIPPVEVLSTGYSKLIAYHRNALFMI
jgi:hypothetical protein